MNYLMILLMMGTSHVMAEEMKTFNLSKMKGCRVEIAQDGDYHYCGEKLIKFVSVKDMSDEELGYTLILGDGYKEDDK